MPNSEESIAPFLAGLAIGALLLFLGGAVGVFLGRRRNDAVGGERELEKKNQAEEIDRYRLLRLLRELLSWTREYRGGVSQFQVEIENLTQRARDSQIALPDSWVSKVTQLMQTSQRLQQRLDAAEKQLQSQTRLIENCLTEARTDSLTELANRRAFDKKLDDLFAAYHRSGQSFVLALVDVDHFKSINDRFGHPVGDEVLREIARRLSLEIEAPLLVSRYGGEEFAVLLPPPLPTAATRMEAFRKLCAASPIHVAGQSLTITVSIGLSEVQNDKFIGPLVRRADEALYAAKGIGRNRTYYHNGRAPALFGAPELANLD